jgi:hypothetical protein
VPPGLLAAPFRHRRNPGLFLSCGGGGRAGAVFAAGDEEPRGEAGPRAWAGWEQGESGMALRRRRDGGVARGAGLHGDAELGDAGLHQERIGRHDACLGGEGGRRLDGVETLCDDLGIAHVMRTEAGGKGGSTGEWYRLEGRPATQEGAEERGVFVLTPVQHLRERVLAGPGQAVGDPAGVADHVTTVCDELSEGAPRGALRLERLQRVALGEPQCALAGGVGGVVCGAAGGEGVAVPRQPQGSERAEDQKVILAPGGDPGALLSARQRATGGPLHRVRSVVPPASMAAGVCAS